MNRRQVINSVYLLRRRIKLLAPHSGGVVERKNNGKKEMETLLASARFGRNLRKDFGKKYENESKTHDGLQDDCTVKNTTLLAITGGFRTPPQYHA